MVDTIYALSSGVGRAGVAVVRVSGPVAPSLPRLIGGRDVAPRTGTLATLRRPQDGEIVDQGLVLFFPAPASFTGEDVVEFHIHGGRAVTAAFLNVLSSVVGVRAAEPGEFTRRAFENGKLDLASAEGLADLIAADTELQRRNAVHQFSGALGRRARRWRQLLVSALALVEAHLDFPDEEEIPEDVTAEVHDTLKELSNVLSLAVAGSSSAEILRDGAVVMIAGPPNSGKSSLMNRIARRDVAIISETPGTTRDLIEITVDLRGLPVTFVDSAGIRDTQDPLEREGIERALSRARTAQLVLWLSPLDSEPVQPGFPCANLLVVRTKQDLVPSRQAEIAISSRTEFGISSLLDRVYNEIITNVDVTEPSALSTQRQMDCVVGASHLIESAIARLGMHQLELAAEEIRLAVVRLQELTGAIATEDILDEVFARFCLGK